MVTSNPFLLDSINIPWRQLTAEKVVPAMKTAMASATDAISLIEKLALDEMTYASTFQALETALRSVGRPWSYINHLDSVNDHPELRKAVREVLPEVTRFFSEIHLNQKLYAQLRTYAGLAAAEELDPVKKRFVKETLADFEDAGAAADEATRERLKAIASELAEKTKSFSEHVLDATNAYELIIEDAAELDGLPESLIEAARQNALAKGKGTEEAPAYRLTLQMPSYVPVIRFVHSDEIRRKMYTAFYNVAHEGEYENAGLISDIIRLRREQAELLGRPSFPDWILARRMAKSGAGALSFVEDLYGKTKAAFDDECRELEVFKAEKSGEPQAPLEPWQIPYWSERLRKERYAFDEEEVRPYFPMESVMSGLFSLVEKIFGVTVQDISEDSVETWHDEVRTYELYDKSSGQKLGRFFADWFPRESKRAGAWMNPLNSGAPESETGPLLPHLGFVAGNMNPPLGGQPALLNHNEVETVFHEFGHLLHHLVSEIRVPSLSGADVAWDFVELPSQIMENWCWERESLDLFARHHETGEPIPEELLSKMKAARNFQAAIMQMRQLSFGKMDLELHLNFDPDGSEDLDTFIERVLEGYRPKVNTQFPTNVRSFQHLFSSAVGYASGYYSYKWAEVLDADAFTRFQKEGLLNEATGMAFREAILSKGNSQPADVLYRNFMGRDPDPEALLRRLGLAS
jgi:oligopeptidase A